MEQVFADMQRASALDGEAGRREKLGVAAPDGRDGDAALAKWFQDAYKRSGKTLRMGESCVRFRGVDGIALPVVAKAIGAVPAERFIAIYEGTRRG